MHMTWKTNFGRFKGQSHSLLDAPPTSFFTPLRLGDSQISFPIEYKLFSEYKDI